ncbi:MAG: lipid IV(A) 3-deoxy-D-manno-octulosonic acid transferase [Pseudomonadales bacterium]
MLRFVYQLLLVAAWPWVQLRLRWRARREPEYGQRIAERFGRLPAEIPAGCVWFHTVSAGETIAAAPLIAELAALFPTQPILVTTMTPTGSAQVRARLGERVHHCYAPYDFPWAVRRFYDRLQPRLLVLMETELWPNLIAAAAARDVPALLVNARLSARSARGYRRVGSLTRSMLGSLQYIACQYPDHAQRFIELGAPAERVLTHGSVKFDLRLPDDHAERVRALAARWGLHGPAWVAGSTHPGEETAVLAAHRWLLQRQPDARLVLVPRHPARAPEVAALCRDQGLSVARQSAPGADDASAQVIVGDTMGELLYLYGLGDVAFVGGSFADVGGHNPIEPALCGKPVLMGPVVHNFADVVAAFRDAGCLQIVADAQQLGCAVARWMDDPAARLALGLRAREVVAANGGATVRLRALLIETIDALAHGDFAQATRRD